MLESAPAGKETLGKSYVSQQYEYNLSDSQSKILKVINQYPGIRYRELARQTGLANGALTYHLNILERINYINKYRHDKTTRYYPADISSQDIKVLSHLRVHSEKVIVQFILYHDLCTFNEIVEHSRKAPSTISWHLRRLCEDGIVKVHHREYNLYQIGGKELVNQVLNLYKESFANKIVNNLIDIADEL
jgi:predicted transcriptional regulator